MLVQLLIAVVAYEATTEVEEELEGNFNVTFTNDSGGEMELVFAGDEIDPAKWVFMGTYKPEQGGPIGTFEEHAFIWRKPGSTDAYDPKSRAMVKCVMTELTESCNFPGGVKIREEPLAEDESTAPITLQMTNLALFFANVATPTKAAKSVPSLYNRYVKKGESMALLAKLRGKYGDALVDDILLAPLTYEPITRAQLAAFFAANNPSKAAVSIPSLMKRYVEKGQGDELIVKLRAKYGDASVHASFVGMIKPKEDVEQEEEEEEKEL